MSDAGWELKFPSLADYLIWKLAEWIRRIREWVRP